MEATVRNPKEFRLVFSGMMVVLALASLDQNIVATALPRIVSDLGGLSRLSWVVTAFMVASTTTTPLYGKLGDVYGRKAAFIVSIIVFLIGSALCGFAASMLQLIIFRAIQGLGAGGLLTLAQATIGDLVPPRERGKYQGMFAGVFAACSVAGPLLGGFITDALSWRWIFYVNIPLGAVALLLIGVALKHRPTGGAHRIDVAGATLIIAATCCTLLVLSWGGNVYAWSSPVIVALAVAALLLFALLVLVEGRAAAPIIPLRLFSIRVFSLAVLGFFFTSMALFGALIFLPLFFQLLMGASPSGAGLMISALMGGVITSAFMGGRLVTATGRYKALTVCGLGAATLAFLCLAGAASQAMGVAVMEVILVVMGLGIGMTMPNLTNALQNAVPRTDLGVATSAAVFFRSLGGAVGVALAGAMLTQRLEALLPAELAAGGGRALLDRGLAEIARLPPAQHDLVLGAYRAALSMTFLSGAVFGALAFATVLFMPERPLRTAAPAAKGAE